MSAAKSKADRAYEIDKQAAQDLVNKIDSMVKSKNEKAEYEKDHLIKSLEVTSQKYLTANGTMAAISIINSVQLADGLSTIERIDLAKQCARILSDVALLMAKMAGQRDYLEMGDLCDGIYDEKYANKDDEDITEEGILRGLIVEVMKLDLCQQVGPSAQDIVDFIHRADDEIFNARGELAKLIEKHPEFKNLEPVIESDIE